MSKCPAKFPAVCDTKCRPGYWSKGRIFATCLSTGDWHYNGECYAFNCFEPQKPDHWDFTNCPDTTYEGRCDVGCEAGYFGNPTAKCGLQAQWEFSGSCEPIPDPEPLPSMYGCGLGLLLQGTTFCFFFSVSLADCQLPVFGGYERDNGG